MTNNVQYCMLILMAMILGLYLILRLTFLTTGKTETEGNLEAKSFLTFSALSTLRDSFGILF